MIVLNDVGDSLLQIRQRILHQYEKHRFSINRTSVEFSLQMEMASYPRDAVEGLRLKDILQDRMRKITPFVNTPRKILIVDDNEQLVKLLVVYLSQKAIRPLQAYSGEQALKLIAQDAPDLILLDMGLPGISGYEVINRLKDDIRTCRIPLIIITGAGVDKEKMKAFQNKISVLLKPVELNLLADLIYRSLNIEEKEVESP